MKRALLTIILFCFTVFQALFAQNDGGEYYLTSIDQGSGSGLTYVYDDQGRVESSMNLSNGAPFIERTFVYDQSNGLIESVNRVVYSFDGSGKASERISSYSHNADLLIDEISTVNIDLSSNVITSTSKSLYNYNDTGKLTETNSFAINEKGQEELEAKKLYLYDDLGQLEFVERYLYSISKDSLILQWVGFYTYDTQGQIEFISFNTEEDDDLGYLIRYTYDEDGNIVSSEVNFENPDYFTEMVEYTYDKLIPNEQLNYPVSFSPESIFVNQYNSQLISRKSTLLDNFGGEVTSSTSFYTWSFEEVETNINTVYSEKVDIWPNPTSDQLKFIGIDSNGNKELIIYDVLGRAAQMDRISSNQNSVTVSELKSGNYFFKIIENKRDAYFGRFVKN